MARLHARTFGGSREANAAQSFLTNVFFGHPWLDEDLPSMKLVSPDGALVGCLGVMPRPMIFDGEPIRAVVTHNFMVDPDHRGGLGAIELMRAPGRRGVDLAICESTGAAREIAEAMGSKVLADRSMRWFRVFRPLELALHTGGADALPSFAGRILHAVGGAMDRALGAVPGLPAGAPRAVALDETAEPSFLVELSDRWARAARLRPVYTVESLTWLLTTLARSRRDQTLRVRVVRRGSDGDALGWYVYYSRPGRVGRVLHMAAAPGVRERVLEGLFADAFAQGNVAVAGQVDPAWTDALSARSCLLWPGRTWVLAHTRHPELGAVLDTPDACLGRLEGEGWLRFGF